MKTSNMIPETLAIACSAAYALGFSPVAEDPVAVPRDDTLFGDCDQPVSTTFFVPWRESALFFFFSPHQLPPPSRKNPKAFGLEQFY
jgi:hypothetical protein